MTIKRLYIVIFIIAISASIWDAKKPELRWEYLNYEAAKNILEYGLPFKDNTRESLLLIHPPITAYLIALSQMIFGMSMLASRLPGVIILIITTLLLFHLSRYLNKSTTASYLASILYVSNPFVLQGMLSLDFSDGNLVPILCVIVVISYLKKSESAKPAYCLLLSFFIGVLFWTKIPTAVLMILALFFTELIRNRSFRSTLWIIYSISAGVLIFLVSWVVYCKYLISIMGQSKYTCFDLIIMPLRYLFGGKAASTIWDNSVFETSNLLIRLAIYAGFMILVLLIIKILIRGKQIFDQRAVVSSDIMFIFPLGVIAFYTIFQGGVGPFPKYFLASMPFIAILSGALLSNYICNEGGSNLHINLIVIFFILSIYYAVFVGDYIYVWNYELRLGIFQNNVNSVILRMVFITILYLLPLFILYLSRGNKILCGKFAAIIVVASQVGLMMSQSASAYALRYQYGVLFHDYSEIVESLKDIRSDGVIITEYSIYYRLKRFKHNLNFVNNFSGTDWNDINILKSVIISQTPDAIIYGLPINTISQIKLINNDGEIQSLLKRNYRMKRIGGFWLWFK